jgi:hypothetical protein
MQILTANGIGIAVLVMHMLLLVLEKRQMILEEI